jgi:hypothetical protein
VWLANIASGQKSLTVGSPLGILQAMRGGFTTGATVRSAGPTRRDLLLEILALRHQLGVLARSNRRFRPADRLLWLFLRWLWPQWREALVLVEILELPFPVQSSRQRRRQAEDFVRSATWLFAM